MGDLRITTGEELPLGKKQARKRRNMIFLVMFLLLAAIVTAGSLIKLDRYTVAAGYVTTEDYAEVRPPVTGIVSKILVSSGKVVQAGEVLVQLNSEEEEALLAETKARVSKLQTEVERRKAEMAIDLERRGVDLMEQQRAHKDNISIAELQLQNAQTRLKLTSELVARGLKAANNLEDDRLKEQLAKVTLTSLQNKDFTIYEELLKRDRSKYDQEIAALANELRALEDAVRRVEARLQTRLIRAPISGMVVRYEFVVGELLTPTSVIYEIFGGDKQVLKLRISERHAIKVGVGQPYRARLAPYKGLIRNYFWGEVEYLRNVIQNDGKTNYRMAYCSFDPGEHSIPPGTTAEARIYYGKSSLWLYIFNVDL
ncbi:MAG: biotin/lipoyl-binding protein [Lentisphaeria bacterium]|nr:biotin/lipoyl-binding protein [Lentisphaeria bacterium]